MDAHAQDFVAIDELLLHLKTLSSSPVPCTLLEMFDVFSLCTVVELSVAPTNSSPVASAIDRSPPHLTRHAPPHGDYRRLVRLAVEIVGDPT